MLLNMTKADRIKDRSDVWRWDDNRPLIAFSIIFGVYVKISEPYFWQPTPVNQERDSFPA